MLIQSHKKNLGVKRHHSDDSDETKLKEPFIDVTDLTKDDDESQIIPIPEISIIEPRFDETFPKNRDSMDPQFNFKISAPQSLNKFLSLDYDNHANLLLESHIKGFNEQVPNEMSEDGSCITMLSSTSLLHGNCVFNRNNTVLLKTYWLCKNYRISLCKARCISFKGKVISATGIHNHVPHHLPNKAPETSIRHVYNPAYKYGTSKNMLVTCQPPPNTAVPLLHDLHLMPDDEASTSSNFKAEQS